MGDGVEYSLAKLVMTWLGMLIFESISTQVERRLHVVTWLRTLIFESLRPAQLMHCPCCDLATNADL